MKKASANNILAYFGYLNEARQKTIEELKQTRAELAKQKPRWWPKQGQQKSYWASNRRSSKSWSRRAAPAENADRAGSLAEKDQQRWWNCARTEARMRDKIARAERESPMRANAKRVKRPGARTGAHQGAAGEENRHDLQTLAKPIAR